MALQFPPIIALYAAAILGTLYLAYQSWQARPARGAASWFMVMVGACLWTLGSGLQAMVETPTAAEWTTRVQYSGVMLTIYWWGVFTIQYSYYEHWLTRRTYIAMGIIPLFFYGLMFTSPWHGAFQSVAGQETFGDYFLITFELDAWFWVWISYAYAVIVGGAALLVSSIWRYPDLYRGQTVAILVGITTPFVLNMLHIVFGAQILGPYDPTSISYAISGFWILIAITRFRFLNITPVAHDLVFQSVNSGVIVIDQQDIIIEANPSARAISHHSANDLVGQPISVVFPQYTALRQRFGTALEIRTEITVSDRHYELQTRPLKNRGDNVVGRIIMFYDVTNQKTAMHSLAQRDAILGTLVDSAEILLQNPNWRQFLPDLLAQLGTNTAASRVYVFERHPATVDDTSGAPVVSQRFSWAAEGIQPQLDNPDLQNLALGNLLPRWVEHLNRGESIQGRITEFPEQERELLQRLDVLSIVIMPIIVHNDWWGFMGFDECVGERVWSPSEMRALRSAANSLGAAISRQTADQERENLIIQLRAAQAAAEANARLKSEFLAIMSHELRTPLNAIEGFTSILLSRLGGVEYNTKTEDFLNRIHSNSERLISLISDFLDITRMESGHMELLQEAFAPRDLARKWQSELGVLAEKKGLQLQVEIDDSLPNSLVGDFEAISKIAVNLLSNAIKFTHEGYIRLRLSADDAYWQIVVEDTGIGIPPEARNVIFAEFRQADQSSTREYGGTGLGLAIVKKLVDLMNGHIRLQSTVGEGSTFIVSLPIKVYEKETTLP